MVAFTVLLLSTNPTQLSSFLLIAPFIMLFSILWATSFLILRRMEVSRSRSIRLSMIIAGLPVGLLLLQSIGQLTVRDVITILAFFGVAYFYIVRLTATRSE